MIRCGLALTGILFIGFLAIQVHSILEGDKVNWNSNAYLIKVFARNRHSDIKNCIGALISNNLAITAASCISNSNNDPLDEFAVSLNIHGNARREKARLLKKTDQWAVLEFHEINTARLCPRNFYMKNVLRINLRPSLKESSVVKVSPDEIMNSMCYMIGFKTQEKGSQFLSTTKTLRLDVKVKEPRQNDQFYRAPILSNYTACFDDVGGPLICETTSHGKMIVGLFQKLGIPIDDQEDTQNQLQTPQNCELAEEMYFSLLTENTELIDFINEFKMGSVIKTYEDCGFL